jgi:hypothetical protein
MKREKVLFLFWRFFFVVEQGTFVDALPVFGQVFPVRSRFHDRIMLCPAHEAFHKSRRFVNQFHHFFFLRHVTNVTTLRVINSWKGSRVLLWGENYSPPDRFFEKMVVRRTSQPFSHPIPLIKIASKNKGSFRAVTFQVRSLVPQHFFPFTAIKPLCQYPDTAASCL